MKNKPCKTAVLAASILMPCFAVQAQEEQPLHHGAHVYVGANYGGFKARGGEFDDEDDFIEAVLGAQVNAFFAVEANYINFGRYGGSQASAKVDGYGLALVGRIPLTRTLGIYAKAGQFWWDADIEILGASRGYSGNEPFYGAGLDFAVTRRLALLLEYNRYKVDFGNSDFPPPVQAVDNDMDTVKVGLRFRF